MHVSLRAVPRGPRRRIRPQCRAESRQSKSALRSLSRRLRESRHKAATFRQSTFADLLSTCSPFEQSRHETSTDNDEPDACQPHSTNPRARQQDGQTPVVDRMTIQRQIVRPVPSLAQRRPSWRELRTAIPPLRSLLNGVQSRSRRRHRRTFEVGPENRIVQVHRLNL